MSINGSVHIRPQERRSGHAHAWLQGLEVFHVPFLCYDANGRRTHVSTAAMQLLDSDCVGSTLGERADQAAGAELQQAACVLLIGEFPLAREAATWLPGLVLAVHLPTVSDSIAAVVIIRPSRNACDDGGAFPELSVRETVVARLIAAGLGTKQIAGRLATSEHTVRHQTERVFAKLGVHNRAAAAALISARVGQGQK